MMITVGTNLTVADNSGALHVRCIKVLGGSRKRVACVGEYISVAIRATVPGAKVTKGSVCTAVVVRVSQKFARKDGSYIKFGSKDPANAVVLVNKQAEMIGTRVFGPIPVELKARGFNKVASLAPEVL